MIEFTLSKMNMLIFVTAIAAIVLFFMGAVNSNLATRQSYEITYKMGQEINQVINNKTTCLAKYIDIPEKIKSGSNSSGIYNTKYKMKLLTQSLNNNDFENKLVIAITNEKEDNIIAGYDIDYNGSFTFYKTTYDEDAYYEDKKDWTKLNESVTYDPLRKYSNDSSFLFVKKVINKKDNYFIFPCERRNGIYTCKEYVCNNVMNDYNLTCLERQICKDND